MTNTNLPLLSYICMYNKLNVQNILNLLSVLAQQEFFVTVFKLVLFKGHRGVHLDFYRLILFYRVLSELSDIFNHLKKFKVIFEK